VLGSGRRSAGLGLRSGPEGQRRLALSCAIATHPRPRRQPCRLRSAAVRKLLAALSITLSAAVMVAPPVWAEPSIQPAGAVDPPQGPAHAWLLADLDNGRILASRNPSE